MNLRHIEIFYLVMVYGSLTEAASVLCISQPAASKLLKHAEQRLGFSLFERVKGKLQPTNEAFILYEQIKPIYDQLNKLNKLTHNLSKNPKGRITVGCLPSLGLSLLPKLAASYLKKYPGVFLNIGTDHTQALEQKLLQREIDIAVTFEPDTLNGVIATPILDIPLVYIDSEQHGTVIDIQDIDEQRWIQPDADSLLRVVKKYRSFERSILNAQTYYMAAELVRQGVGCSITDVYTAVYSLPEQMIYPIQPPLHTTIYLLRNANVPTTHATDNFITLIKNQIEAITPVLNKRL
ncbi:LysR family transcriptional regulator [Acinetobacter larvae]|uniref:LysR family transcriptional regulator n=1 Tax=Acinetobacter larvae TaxID=1789224 RepID=A0A1B2LVR9_9GAMM|nr:LysR family transcriptional regulator [Acinetobacter larvae]AOA57028.1 LysR family transcriptional regulator [Acinetobacter larvae]